MNQTKQPTVVKCSARGKCYGRSKEQAEASKTGLVSLNVLRVGVLNAELAYQRHKVVLFCF